MVQVDQLGLSHDKLHEKVQTRLQSFLGDRQQNSNLALYVCAILQHFACWEDLQQRLIEFLGKEDANLFVMQLKAEIVGVEEDQFSSNVCESPQGSISNSVQQLQSQQPRPVPIIWYGIQLEKSKNYSTKNQKNNISQIKRNCNKVHLNKFPNLEVKAQQHLLGVKQQQQKFQQYCSIRHQQQQQSCYGDRMDQQIGTKRMRSSEQVEKQKEKFNISNKKRSVLATEQCRFLKGSKESEESPKESEHLKEGDSLGSNRVIRRVVNDVPREQAARQVELIHDYQAGCTLQDEKRSVLSTPKVRLVLRALEDTGQPGLVANPGTNFKSKELYKMQKQDKELLRQEQYSDDDSTIIQRKFEFDADDDNQAKHQDGVSTVKFVARTVNIKQNHQKRAYVNDNAASVKALQAPRLVQLNTNRVVVSNFKQDEKVRQIVLRKVLIQGLDSQQETFCLNSGRRQQYR
eukprot:TRINITY_DN27909_c0_g1_i2.p1 TRINITY_DN27909_c0_g1~~TRINITY_DN27909_c0_g1_i2.p1  ORF type:complete len:460 (+),score=32.26 TRINITY_DN27909_c0_g1_i2:132-1511(+)